MGIDKDKICGRLGLTIGMIPALFAALMPVDIMRHKGVLSFPVAVTIMVIISGGAVWLYIYVFSLMGGSSNKALLKNGEAAVARVLEKVDTGFTINTQPQVELLLEIHRVGHPAYQTKITTLIPRLQPDLLNPDTILEVRVDPKKLKKVAIVGIVNS